MLDAFGLHIEISASETVDDQVSVAKMWKSKTQFAKLGGEADDLFGTRIVMAVPFLACMALAASLYHLPPRVLPSIRVVEGGSIGSSHANPDGSSDFGLMQVNSVWLPSLSRYTHMAPGAVREKLIFDPCFNIAAAGAILRSYIDETHGDLLLAIGDYHSHTPTKNRAYQAQVIQSAMHLFVGPQER
jgi:hypothetical protein